MSVSNRHSKVAGIGPISFTPGRVDYTQNVFASGNEQTIADAERFLHVRFPPKYKAALLRSRR
jgi:hypothetical protein